MLVTLKKRMPLVVPPALQRRAGLNTADKLEFGAVPGAITITAVDGYTPEQRRIIDARLAKAKRSLTHGPFTAAQATLFLKNELRARSKKSRKSAMNVALEERAVAALAEAPPPVQRAFIKQMNFLARNLQHPSLRAKKYDQVQNLWQARVNDDWRFLFHHRR
jgi:hypothetical protein